MAETLTPNYGWTKPDPGASANTWGATLNATTDKVDAQVFANQQGLVLIGGGMFWFTDTAPANFVFAQGQSLPTAAPYDKLFAIFGYKYGGSGANFNMPPLTQKFVMGAAAGAVGAQGGSTAVSLAVANLPSHAHTIQQTPHSHSAQQNAHNHVITTNNHGHNIHTGSHSHAIPLDLVNPSAGGLTNGGASFGLAGGQRTDTAGDLGGYTDTAGNLGGYTDTQTPGVGVNANYANINGNTTDPTGSGAAFNVVPPYVTINVAIRYQ